MSETENKQTTEEKEELESYTTEEIAEFMDHTQNSIIAIKAILQKFKDDIYEKQESKDTLDELLEEVQDSIECMGDMF